MAYAEVIGYATGSYNPAIVKVAHVTKTAQLDGVWFKNHAGIIPLVGVTTTNATNGATVTATFSYNSIRVNNSGTAYTATSTQIVYNEWSGLAAASQRSSGNYYVYNGSTDEIIYVVKDSAPTSASGTLDVIRGCLGTTAAVPADDNFLMVMNSVVLPNANTGKMMIFYLEMPSDPKATFTGPPQTA
jgi:hypothetical protein